MTPGYLVLTFSFTQTNNSSHAQRTIYKLQQKLNLGEGLVVVAHQGNLATIP